MDRLMGKTPLHFVMTAVTTEERAYVITFQLRGYEDAEREAVLATGTKVTLHVDMLRPGEKPAPEEEETPEEETPPAEEPEQQPEPDAPEDEQTPEPPEEPAEEPAPEAAEKPGEEPAGVAEPAPVMGSRKLVDMRLRT